MNRRSLFAALGGAAALVATGATKALAGLGSLPAVTNASIGNLVVGRTTHIDGGSIKAGSITADQIQVGSLCLNDLTPQAVLGLAVDLIVVDDQHSQLTWDKALVIQSLPYYDVGGPYAVEAGSFKVEDDSIYTLVWERETPDRFTVIRLTEFKDRPDAVVMATMTRQFGVTQMYARSQRVDIRGRDPSVWAS